MSLLGSAGDTALRNLTRDEKRGTPVAEDAGEELSYVRLSVNINDETQAAIRRVRDRHGVSATEAVRRLIGYGSYVDEWHHDHGCDVVIRTPKGYERKLVLIEDDEGDGR